VAKKNKLRRRAPQGGARNSAAAKKRGRAKIPSPQPPSFLPARAQNFKIQRQDFLGKKLGFCSGDTASEEKSMFPPRRFAARRPN